MQLKNLPALCILICGCISLSSQRGTQDITKLKKCEDFVDCGLVGYVCTNDVLNNSRVCIDCDKNPGYDLAECGPVRTINAVVIAVVIITMLGIIIGTIVCCLFCDGCCLHEIFLADHRNDGPEYFDDPDSCPDSCPVPAPYYDDQGRGSNKDVIVEVQVDSRNESAPPPPPPPVYTINPNSNQKVAVNVK